MADSYIGEIRIFPYGYAPDGWLECNGQVLSTSADYRALYAVIGNTYGGTAPSTFALPNLQGYVPVGAGQGPGLSPYTLGGVVKGGTVAETITETKMPAHSHSITVRVGKNDPSKEGNAVFLADPVNADWNAPMSRPNSATNYTLEIGFSPKATGGAYLAPATLTPAGGVPKVGTEAHVNQQPFVEFRFCICCSGIFPIRP